MRLIETDIFAPENEQNTEISVDFKNQVFFLMEHKRIKDIFNESLKYFEIDGLEEDHTYDNENYMKSENSPGRKKTIIDKNVHF